MDSFVPTPSYIQKHLSLTLTAHIKSNLRGTCQKSSNKGVSPGPNKFFIQKNWDLIWTVMLVRVIQLQNLQVLNCLNATEHLRYLMRISAIVISPEALLGRTYIQTSETGRGQHETCTQEMDSIMFQSRGKGPNRRYSQVSYNGKDHAEGQYSSSSQTNSHYRQTGWSCCQARVLVSNPLSQHPDPKVRPSLKNPNTQFFGLGWHNNHMLIVLIVKRS